MQDFTNDEVFEGYEKHAREMSMRTKKYINKYKFISTFLVLMAILLFLMPIFNLNRNNHNDIRCAEEKKLLELVKTHKMSSDNDIKTENQLVDNNIIQLPMIKIKGYKCNNEILGKQVYLTFDDGPTSNTEKILDILSMHNIKASFFMLGPNMLKYPDSVIRMKNEGHGIGLHGMTHSYKEFYSTSTSPLDEMNRANNILEKIIGQRSSLVRTPYGSIPYLKPEQQVNLYKNGYRIWDWTVDSNDYRSSKLTPEYVINLTINQIKKQRQPIILMHDRKFTVNCLEKIINFLRENNYEFFIL